MTKENNVHRPGTNSGRDGGIYQEIGPRGGPKPNYTTVPDNTTFPPTRRPGHGWSEINRTPDSKL